MKLSLTLLFIPMISSAICGKIEIRNNTKIWTEADNRALNQAKLGCERIFPEAPCVKVFIKKDDYLYNIICGK